MQIPQVSKPFIILIILFALIGCILAGAAYMTYLIDRQMPSLAQ